jgi:hypothetical protein
MRELIDKELDAVGGGFFNANNGSEAIFAVVVQRNRAIQVGVNAFTVGSSNVNVATQSNTSSIGSAGPGPGPGPGPGHMVR